MYLLLSRCVALLSALLIPGTVALESITSNKESLLWGPYRSNHYLGIRPRIPESLIMGLMWGKLGDEQRTSFRASSCVLLLPGGTCRLLTSSRKIEVFS